MMKKYLKFLSCMIAVLMLSLSLVTFASAADDGSSVVYKDGMRVFTFSPGSDYSGTDLFTNFKDVMPGDIIHQPIKVINHKENNVKINVYIRSLGAHDDSEELLSQMNLVVKCDGVTLSDASANEAASLSDWVKLGTLMPGESKSLDVLLNVSKEMGNDFAEKIGYIDWQFMIEEIPEETINIEDETPGGYVIGEDIPGAGLTLERPVKTSDSNNVILYLTIFITSAACIAFVAVKKL